MSNFGKSIIVDTGFWYAFYDATDQRYKEAQQKADYLETTTLLVPWPSLYETINTRFAKNKIGMKRFETLLQREHVRRISDEPYRESALEVAFSTVPTRNFALVDVVIRLILEDIGVRKHGLLTVDPNDFRDLCLKHRVELL